MPARKKKTTETPSVFPEHDILELMRKSVRDITDSQLKIINILDTQAKGLSAIAKQLSALLKLAEAFYEYQLEEEEIEEEEEEERQDKTPAYQEAPTPIEPPIVKSPPAKHSLAKTFERLKRSKVI